MPDPLTIGVCPAGTTVRITLLGELDLATSDRLYRILMACAFTEPERLEIDLGGLDFIDSWGGQAIVRAHQEIEPNCAFRVRGAGRLAALVLDVVGLDPGAVELLGSGRAVA